MFTGATSDFKNLKLHNQDKQIEQLMFFPFTSTRKRASSIVRLNGVIKLLSKGADSIIIERMAPESKTPQPFLKYINENLDNFSKVGLRTLCMAERIISESEFKIIQQKFNEASVSADPKDAVAKLAEDIENNLTLIGCSAVEDRLQDEVPETIRDFIKAGNAILLTNHPNLPF